MCALASHRPLHIHIDHNLHNTNLVVSHRPCICALVNFYIVYGYALGLRLQGALVGLCPCWVAMVSLTKGFPMAMVRATSHTRLKALDDGNLRALICRKGGDCPSSLHTQWRRPKGPLKTSWMKLKVYMESYMADYE